MEITKRQNREGEHEYIPELKELRQKGRVSRREFLRNATLLGMSFAGASAFLASCSPAAEPTATPATKSPESERLKTQRAWLWVTTTDMKAEKVAKDIWDNLLQDEKLETAQVIRADVVDDKMVVVPVVGKLKVQGPKGPITIIVEEIEKYDDVEKVDSFTVITHNPSIPDADADAGGAMPTQLNGWG